jgi:hypothetical protein
VVCVEDGRSEEGFLWRDLFFLGVYAAETGVVGAGVGRKCDKIDIKNLEYLL